MCTTSLSQSAIELRPRCAISLYNPENNKLNKKVLEQQIANLSFGLDEIIQIRELDKRYTHANPRKGKCHMEKCTKHATHWITRNNANYCQSDMACSQHVLIWMEVKDLISDLPSFNSK